MRKGVSPVIAVVLLIAIAVIAAVGVWYWVVGLAAKPPMADTTQRAFVITDCNTSSDLLLIRNTGGVRIDISNATIFNDSDDVAYFGINLSKLDVGAVEWRSTSGSGITSGMNYYVAYKDLPEVSFNCP